MQASKNAKRQVAYQFTEEALQEAGTRPGVPPFAIVASNTMDMSVGRYVLVVCRHTLLLSAKLAVHLDLLKHQGCRSCLIGASVFEVVRYILAFLCPALLHLP